LIKKVKIEDDLWYNILVLIPMKQLLLNSEIVAQNCVKNKMWSKKKKYHGFFILATSKVSP